MVVLRPEEWVLVAEAGFFTGAAFLPVDFLVEEAGFLAAGFFADDLGVLAAAGAAGA